MTPRTRTDMKTITECGISGAHEFHSLWKLSRLPLTERFGPYRENHDDLSFDQELVISLPTGHVQLRQQLAPTVLYTSSAYSFRTSASRTARDGTAFFISFLKRIVGNRSFRSLADIGGNDRHLANQLAGYVGARTVIDPICAADDGRDDDGVHVIGRFIEQVNLAQDLPRPDLVVCRHTLEHISEPRAVIDQWFRQCDPDCLYVIEVPCFENLVEAQRFDAIFHQHFHYYDLASFKYLIWECGGEYLGHTINHQGSCGGALLVAFRRAKSRQPQPVIDLPKRIAWIENRIRRYREQMAIMSELLEQLPKPVYGYGASLMLATLGYHLSSDFSGLECILDDDPTRDGATYENVPVTVRHMPAVAPAPNSSYIITSLENARPLFRRLLELTPRRILVPMIN